MNTSKGTSAVSKYPFTIKIYFIAVMVGIYIHNHIYTNGKFLKVCIVLKIKVINQKHKPKNSIRVSVYFLRIVLMGQENSKFSHFF